MNFISFLLFILGITCFGCSSSPDYSATLIVKNVGNRDSVFIAFQHDDWCERQAIVVKNTCNDSIEVWGKYFEPGQTGLAYRVDGIGCEPYYEVYSPYKATQGELIIRYDIYKTISD